MFTLRKQKKIPNSSFRTNLNKGFAALFITILVLVIFFGIVVSVTILTLGEQKISSNIVISNQAYYAAEAGIEDALLRLAKSKNWSSPYNLSINDNAATVEISDTIGGSRTITANGNVKNRIRKVQTVYQITANQISFHYGIQVGDSGLTMDGNARVYGNIFSNGPITGASNTKIYGDAISAGDTGTIESMEVSSSEGGGNVWAKNCEDSEIDGELHYTSKINCTAGSEYYHGPGDYVESQDMPITAEQINEWQNEAAAGGTISGYSLGGNDEDSLGPIKVDGDMNISSNATLTVTGTIWVTGNLSLNSNAVIQLGPGYGSFSGMIVVGGKITADSNVTLCGSEGYKGGRKCYSSVGSYLMLLSTNNSIDYNNPAIYATSNTKTAILYASDGLIRLSSNAKLRETTGYGIYMDSNAEVTYEVGLANSLFSAGPGGGWEVTSWQEIE